MPGNPRRLDGFAASRPRRWEVGPKHQAVPIRIPARRRRLQALL
jgi:hypothetical protein